MTQNQFSWTNMMMVLGLSLLVGVGAYGVAWQFNDGKMGIKVFGAIFLGMALPSIMLGGVMRLFRPDLQRYFAISAVGFLLIGLILILN